MLWRFDLAYFCSILYLVSGTSFPRVGFVEGEVAVPLLQFANYDLLLQGEIVGFVRTQARGPRFGKGRTG